MWLIIQVKTAQSGAEALALLSRTDLDARVPEVDVILKSHDPPHGNALKFLNNIKGIEGHEKLPIVGKLVSLLQ